MMVFHQGIIPLRYNDIFNRLLFVVFFSSAFGSDNNVLSNACPQLPLFLSTNECAVNIALGYCHVNCHTRSLNAFSCSFDIIAGFSVSTREPTTSICILCRFKVIASSKVNQPFFVENHQAGSVIDVGLRTVQ